MFLCYHKRSTLARVQYLILWNARQTNYSANLRGGSTEHNAAEIIAEFPLLFKFHLISLHDEYRRCGCFRQHHMRLRFQQFTERALLTSSTRTKRIPNTVSFMLMGE